MLGIRHILYFYFDDLSGPDIVIRNNYLVDRTSLDPNRGVEEKGRENTVVDKR